jgi:periplasmic protein TonB
MHVLGEQNHRTFAYAAAASLVVHALVLSLKGPALRESGAPPPEPPLVAHLVESAAPPVPEVVEPRPEPKPAARAVAKPKPKPAPRLTAPIATPTEPPAAETMTEQRPEESKPSPPEPAPSVPSAPPTPPLAAVVPPAAAQIDPAAAIARFRQQIVDLAARYKRYPRRARDNGWTGDVVVRIEVAPSGSVNAVSVKTSSGYDVLDDQALEMFRKAAAEVAVAAGLRGSAFAVEVRAIYSLQPG